MGSTSRSHVHKRLIAFRNWIATEMSTGLTALNGLELTLSQAVAMFALAHRRAIGMNELQLIVDRSQAATSKLVEGLEQRGLVARSPHPEDRRRRIVALTPEGHAALTKIEASRREALDAMLDLLPESTIERLYQALGEVLDALDA